MPSSRRSRGSTDIEVMTPFNEYIQGLINNSDRGSDYVAVMFPFSEWTVRGYGDSTFSRRMDHPFVAERLILSEESARRVMIDDLSVDHWSLFQGDRTPASWVPNPSATESGAARNLKIAELGLPPYKGEHFAPTMLVSLNPRLGFEIQLRIRSTVAEDMSDFEAAVLGKVQL